MNEPIQETGDAPVWARDDAFPLAPKGWGWIDVKHRQHPCESLDALALAIRDDRNANVELVWSPSNGRMILPEELAGMGDSLRAARDRWTRDDLDDGQSKLRWFGLLLAVFAGWAFLRGFAWAGQLATASGIAVSATEKLAFASRAMFKSTPAGLALLIFLIFAFIPWYQARKNRQNLSRWTEAGIADAAPAIRFETWLSRQRAPWTMGFLALIGAVALAQMMAHVRTDGLGALTSLFHNWDGTTQAGLLKDKYFQGEWWRLFTAPFLHGNIVHLLMNAAAMLYLGKRLEVFARWPHLPLVFLFAACVGGEASARFIAAPSVGASGGLMGWLGFLMVFETLHKRLVPLRARRRLAAGVLFTALIGVIGFAYIDNAAHAGGLAAGMLYAVIVFPPSSSPIRPRSTIPDRVAGVVSMGVLIAAAMFAISRILAG